MCPAVFSTAHDLLYVKGSGRCLPLPCAWVCALVAILAVACSADIFVDDCLGRITALDTKLAVCLLC